MRTITLKGVKDLDETGIEDDTCYILPSAPDDAEPQINQLMARQRGIRRHVVVIWAHRMINGHRVSDVHFMIPGKVYSQVGDEFRRQIALLAVGKFILVENGDHEARNKRAIRDVTERLDRRFRFESLLAEDVRLQLNEEQMELISDDHYCAITRTL